jgi:GcrA cell cycle regulator
MPPWTAAEQALLIKRVAEGKSVSVVAKEMGRSRSSVVGRAFRMKLKFHREKFGADRPKKTRQAEPVAPIVKPIMQHLHAGNIAGKKESRQFDPEFKHVTPAAAVEPLLVQLLDLRANQCRFPIGDPLKEDFGFCGHPKEQGAYCRAHARIAYYVPEARRRVA